MVRIAPVHGAIGTLRDEVTIHDVILKNTQYDIIF